MSFKYQDDNVLIEAYKVINSKKVNYSDEYVTSFYIGNVLHTKFHYDDYSILQTNLLNLEDSTEVKSNYDPETFSCLNDDIILKIKDFNTDILTDYNLSNNTKIDYTYSGKKVKIVDEKSYFSKLNMSMSSIFFSILNSIPILGIVVLLFHYLSTFNSNIKRVYDKDNYHKKTYGGLLLLNIGLYFYLSMDSFYYNTIGLDEYYSLFFKIKYYVVPYFDLWNYFFIALIINTPFIFKSTFKVGNENKKYIQIKKQILEKYISENFKK